jgi:hypothetical protein
MVSPAKENDLLPFESPSAKEDREWLALLRKTPRLFVLHGALRITV